jgi:hypothetical protein
MLASNLPSDQLPRAALPPKNHQQLARLLPLSCHTKLVLLQVLLRLLLRMDLQP